MEAEGYRWRIGAEMTSDAFYNYVDALSELFPEWMR
jgi:hypothetical protein